MSSFEQAMTAKSICGQEEFTKEEDKTIEEQWVPGIHAPRTRFQDILATKYGDCRIKFKIHLDRNERLR